MLPVTGVDQFFHRLGRLMDSPVATRELRKAAVSGLRVMGREMKANAPKRTGRLQRATGKPVFSRGTGRRAKQKLILAKVGINTGQKGNAFAPQGHLAAVGTFPRWTGLERVRVKGGGRLGRPIPGKKIAFRGFVSPNPWIKRAAMSKAAQALEAMTESLRTDWDRLIEAAKR